MGGRRWVQIGWGLGCFLQFFHIVGVAERGAGGGAREPGADRGEVAHYKTPRPQVLGLNHNTANYLLLTRKNERGLRMKKNRIVRKR